MPSDKICPWLRAACVETRCHAWDEDLDPPGCSLIDQADTATAILESVDEMLVILKEAEKLLKEFKELSNLKMPDPPESV